MCQKWLEFQAVLPLDPEKTKVVLPLGCQRIPILCSALRGATDKTSQSLTWGSGLVEGAFNTSAGHSMYKAATAGTRTMSCPLYPQNKSYRPR